MTGHIEKFVFIIITILGISLIGCNSAMPPQTSVRLVQITETVAPILSYTATPIVSLQVPTKIIEPTSTAPGISIATPITINNKRIKSQCLKVVEQAPDKNLGEGIVVLDTFGSGYSLWNMETGEKINLEIDSNLTSANSSVSPNSKLLALEKFKTGNEYKVQLDIMDSSGQIKKTLDGDYLQSINPAWSWLNNQQLIFNVTFLYPETPGYNNPKHFLALNPFTGEQKYLVASFPQIDDGYPVSSWDYPWNQSRVAYNSTLSHAVYLGENATSYELWDFNKGKSVMNILSPQGYSHAPRWSLDGSKFLLVGFLGDVSNLPSEFIYHLYMVDTTGKITVLDDGLNWGIGGYFWSPSGRYIALYVYQDDYYYRLVVLDTQSMVFTDYCINFVPAGDFIEQPPVWSPNESQLILEDRISQPSEGELSRLILVDLAKGMAVQVAEDTQAKGWMTSSP